MLAVSGNRTNMTRHLTNFGARAVVAGILWLSGSGWGSLGAAGAEQGWPGFRGPHANGHAGASIALPTTWNASKNVAWAVPIHDRGWSSPVALNDRVWLTTAREDGKQLFVLCVDFRTGNILHDIKLFDVAQPQEIHKFNSHASPTPALEEERVYAHFGSDGTACLNAESGEVIWQRRDLPCNHWRGAGSSPVIFEDELILHFDGYDFQYVIALDKMTGETIWKKDRDVDYGTDDGDIMKAFCTPVVIDVKGQRQLISPTSKASIAYDPRTGEEVWRVRFNGFSATAQPAYGLGLVFINSGFGKADLLAVRPEGRGDLTDSQVVWQVGKSIGSKPSHLLVDDLIYVVHDQGVLTCLEAQSGATVWMERLGGNFSASPIYAGGLLYFCSEEGITTVVRPGRVYQQVAVNEFGDGFMSSPAVYGNSLLLRSRTHLYRISE